MAWKSAREFCAWCGQAWTGRDHRCDPEAVAAWANNTRRDVVPPVDPAPSPAATSATGA